MLVDVQEASVGLQPTWMIVRIEDNNRVIKNKISRYGLESITTGVLRSRTNITATEVRTSMTRQLNVSMAIPAGSETFR